MANTSRSGGKKGRKIGRNKNKCAEYRKLHKYEQNRVRRLLKHIKKYKDNSPMATHALKKYRGLCRIV